MKEMKRLRFRPLAEPRSFGSGLIIGCILASMIYAIMYRSEEGIDHRSILTCKLPPSSSSDDAATANSSVEEGGSILSTSSDPANEEDKIAINSSLVEEKVLITGRNESVDEEEEGTKVKNDKQASAKPSAVDHNQPEALPAKKPICDFSQYRLDICDLEGDIRVTGKNLSSVMLVASRDAPASSWEIKPYPRKYDHSAKAKVRSFNVTTLHASAAPNCDVRHSVPGVLFSTGGHCGNCFHDFADVLVPLFQTAGPLRRQVRFAISSLKGWWMMKYRPYLTQLSAFDVIDLDGDDRVHCFDRLTVGLRAKRDLMIDAEEAPDGHSIAGFVELTRSVYGLGRAGVGPKKNPTKPRLLFIARGGTRKFANLDALTAERFARRWCDVLVGVHGAGLTNFLFLPTGAVVVQVVPLGKLDWIATNFYAEPAMGMNLEYIQYDITIAESTLLDAYPRDDKVFTDPESIHKEGWHRILEVYLRQQSVRLDVDRFRPVLEKAYGLVRDRDGNG
ncbi:beta-1,2-xylosyltransferase XYXT1-like [Zingiber officinale]|uniref:beta-1,2-xylosyltransferase XYXT1-like n=1 Tax=Zingiber officinale TaxID=94328 RepID=UPI001C4C2A2B|nr:beta-1,2-xylosyltransferase XYXT1-like [Zingiber officinale]